MKKKVYAALAILFFVIQGIAQTNLPFINSAEYDLMKMQGTLPQGVQFPVGPVDVSHGQPVLQQSISQNRQTPNQGPNRAPNPVSWCSCMVPIDASFSVAPFSGYTAPDYRNDDGSTGVIALPFSFCLYGTNYNSVYINNNGNLSFGSAYGTFTSVGFPSSNYVMVAPFWADVDTRGAGSGLVYYKISPTNLIVQWQTVGYYSMMTDKLSTFQVIITNGADAIIPPGDNVAFCYGDMQWTTGAASSGVNGFGGSPATVGINKGDGINFIQMGQFDQPGAAYPGPYAPNDGVDWLDNKSFYFNTCSATNMPPVVSGFNNCDTLKICGTGDTLVISGMFLSPESGQTTTVSINLNGTPNTTILYNSSGNIAAAGVMVVADPANAGNNIITFTATDNGTPTGVSVVSVNVYVDTTGISLLHPLVSGNAAFCQGDSIQLSVSPTTYTYFWSNGAATPSTYVHNTGQYWVTSTLNNCSKTNFIDVIANQLPTPVITGPIITACGTGTTTLTCDSLIYASYLWSNGSPTSSITVGGGTYTLTVVDTNGCTDTSPPVTVTSQPAPTILAHNDTSFCNGSANLWVTFTGSGIPASCGATTSGPCATTTPYVVGTGVSTGWNNYPSPFTGLWDNGRIQILYTAAELNALGYAGGKINSLAFDVAQKNSSMPYDNFTLRIGCTNLISLSTFQTLATTVFGPVSYSTTLGWNTFNFANAYEWDGVSNIIVEACYSNASWTSDDMLNKTTMASNLTIEEHHDFGGPGCSFSAPTTYVDRPNIRFEACNTFQNPANFNYQWTAIPASATIANASAQITTGTPVVPTQFAVVVTNINGGCSATDTVSVGVINISTMHIDSIAPVCTASPIDTLVISVPIGTGVFSGSGITDTILGVFDPSQAAIGLDTIRYTVTGNICGSGTTYILVQVDNTLNPTITPVAPLCTSYSPITLHAATAGGSWSGYGITDTLLGTFDPSLPGLVGYDSITYTIYHPCYSRDTVLIHVTQQLNATINPTAGPYCIGVAPFSFSSNGTGGVDTWAGPGMSANGLFNPYLAGPGTHTITHYLSAFCGDTATATVTVLANPTSTISSDRVDGCEPTVIHFTSNNNTPGGSCFWDFGDGHTSTNTDPTNTYTSYNGGVPYNVTMIYTDLNQCKDTVNTPAMITIFSQPHASFSVTPQPTDITQPEIHFLDASTGVIDTWAWTFGDGQGSALQNPTYSYADTGRYQIVLTVSNLHNCIDTAHGEVVIDPILTCYIPNAFTPGDENGRNDEFRIMGTNILAENFQMQIFDRWGERVFYSQDFIQGWNGRKSNVGGILEMGVYVYKINLKDWKGLEHEYIGHITMRK